MPNASTIYGGGSGVPIGDSIRTSGPVTITGTGASPTTILNLTSTSGVLKKIRYSIVNTLGSVTDSGLNVLKVTIDGASARNLYASGTPGLEYYRRNFAANDYLIWDDLIEINFNTSLKIEVSKTDTDITVQAVCEYYVRS